MKQKLLRAGLADRVEHGVDRYLAHARITELARVDVEGALKEIAAARAGVCAAVARSTGMSYRVVCHVMSGWGAYSDGQLARVARAVVKVMRIGKMEEAVEVGRSGPRWPVPVEARQRYTVDGLGRRRLA